MEVHFTPEQEAQLSEIARQTGTDTERVVKEAALRLLKQDEHFRAAVRKGLEQADRGSLSRSGKWTHALTVCLSLDAYPLDSAAADDLQHIFDYLRETSPNLARSTVIENRKAVRSLKRLPHRGRPGREPGTRELLHIRLPQIVAYRVTEDAVEVLRIWHPAQDRS